jgi:hypothetical protein
MEKKIYHSMIYETIQNERRLFYKSNDLKKNVEIISIMYLI